MKFNQLSIATLCGFLSLTACKQFGHETAPSTTLDISADPRFEDHPYEKGVYTYTETSGLNPKTMTVSISTDAIVTTVEAKFGEVFKKLTLNRVTEEGWKKGNYKETFTIETVTKNPITGKLTETKKANKSGQTPMDAGEDEVKKLRREVNEEALGFLKDLKKTVDEVYKESIDHPENAKSEVNLSNLKIVSEHHLGYSIDLLDRRMKNDQMRDREDSFLYVLWILGHVF